MSFCKCPQGYSLVPGLSERRPARIKIRLPDFGETPSVGVRVAIPSDPAAFRPQLFPWIPGVAQSIPDKIECQERDH